MVHYKYSIFNALKSDGECKYCLLIYIYTIRPLPLTNILYLILLK